MPKETSGRAPGAASRRLPSSLVAWIRLIRRNHVHETPPATPPVLIAFGTCGGARRDHHGSEILLLIESDGRPPPGTAPMPATSVDVTAERTTTGSPRFSAGTSDQKASNGCGAVIATASARMTIVEWNLRDMIFGSP